MALTRFYDRTSNRDGPVSGALQIVPLCMTDITGSAGVSTATWKPPAGMSFCIVAADVRAHSITAVVNLRIGTTVDGTHLLNNTALATDTGPLTLKSTTLMITNGNTLQVRATATTTGRIGNLTVTLVGYITKPPTVVAWPNR